MYVYLYTAAATKNARATFADGACQIARMMPKHTSTWQLALISLLAPTPFLEKVKSSMMVTVVVQVTVRVALMNVFE